MANLFDQGGDGDYVGVPGNISTGLPATSVKGTPPGDPTRNEASNFALTYRNRDLFGGMLTLQGFYYDFYARYGAGIFTAFQDAAIAPVGTLVDQSALSSEKYGAKLTITEDVKAAVQGVDFIHTDVWVSMGEPKEVWKERIELLKPYQVNARLMAKAKPDAIFMHCLPAHRGEEVTDEVMDGPRSVVFDEAENRLHAQKGILTWCLNAGTR